MTIGHDDEARIAASDALHARVRREIDRSGPATKAELDALALDIARYQVEHVATVRRLVASRGIELDALTDIDDFPAVPTDAFRLRRVAAHPPKEDLRIFRTSGTTAGRRGEHPFRVLETYARAAVRFGERMLWPDAKPRRVVVLAPRADELVDSSLSFMIDLFAETLAVPTSHHLGPDGIDWPSLASAVRDAQRDADPVLLFGTSFAFVYLLDGLGERADLDLRLPPGSRAMLTGGFKGRTREVGEHELRDDLARALGLAPDHIVGEYGMTELSSQLYEPRLAGGGELYVAPPWVRVLAVDPESLRPVGAGREGLCRVVDLANVDSAIAIQTSDRIVVEERGIRLLGRAKGAPPRGCSLAIEEIMQEEHRGR